MATFAWITTAGWILWALYALIALRWVWGHCELTQIARRQLVRPVTPTDSTKTAERVSVILAAHNEAAGIEACLARILAQDSGPAQIIVATDRCTDATAALVRAAAAKHPNIMCVEIAELPPGWLGKTHALSVAARHATGEWLAFTDADVVWHPALLTTALDLARREQLDLLSLWPKTILVGFWERLLLPACGWVVSLWFNPLQRGAGRKPLHFANGQFLLLRRAAYEQIGGHAAVPNDVAEDVALAYRAAAAGLRQHVGLGRELLATRMYENRRQIRDGWTRIFIGALRGPGRLVASVVGIVLGVWSVAAVLVGLGIVMARGGTWGAAEAAWLAAAVVHLVAMYAAFYRHLALGTEGRAHVLLLPVALVGVVGILTRALLAMHGVGTMCWGGMDFTLRGPLAVRAAARE